MSDEKKPDEPKDKDEDEEKEPEPKPGQHPVQQTGHKVPPNAAPQVGP